MNDVYMRVRLAQWRENFETTYNLFWRWIAVLIWKLNTPPTNKSTCSPSHSGNNSPGLQIFHTIYKGCSTDFRAIPLIWQGLSVTHYQGESWHEEDSVFLARCLNLAAISDLRSSVYSQTSQEDERNKNWTMKRLLHGTLRLRNSPTSEQIQNGRTTDEIQRDPITPWCGPPLFCPCFSLAETSVLKIL